MSVFACGRFSLSLERPLLMGILNVTPDSFSDGGSYNRLDAALAHAERLLADGADILDIGGESTRPGAPYVSPEEELQRVLPLLERLAALQVPLSLDTRRTSVMRAALQAGAVDLINDVSALEDDGALALVAAANVGICLMHKQGNPDTMQQQPDYADVVQEVGSYLARRIELCLAHGIARDRLLADPGFGFGKTLEHNLDLLRALPQLEVLAGAPLLVGMSRKSMLGAITGEQQPDQRLGASVAAALLAAQRGAKVIRVHDVKATHQALQVWQALG
ncbi:MULTISPECIES: dihydropteroate synthase [Vogesella]|uniref:dihydropteroate synthase n=1 Tax=Vogesella TaxID=57739 RepID=UPI00210BC96C|nr:MULTISPECIES: dihydropteroate synthase [Vogesella]MCQ4145510.1 dihydropteroate synthase [Vogesella sp. AC12]MDC7699123.1 dihydropteroate synthase [Vogesella indigofera]